uniref:PD-(D/E)XK nuclease family transposase n=1 Tax=Candidatus Kentrum sp. LPFa TaxID=2126335 RepID=A0A450VPT3_9GAMM|nr:MAG: PD-(D/E)XK nuclease family transposase [Candidatus Kentron sp. LPFa]VFK33218.1 MAG: PD-(D/E)XK nuclease family transposase [Candidatus Kentron sp. LPFa]
MQIANPIYDVVFKHLLEDNDIARLLVATILGREVVEISPLPQEKTIPIEKRRFTVYHLDYAARIRKPDGGYEQVIIEIQKAKFPADIMRFRRYLGNQYERKENTFTVRIDGKEQERPLPIVAIYFLGYPLDQLRAPVIQVARQCYDITTGERLSGREEFIESLTHDAFIIQIPSLRKECKTDLEQLLTLFDQRRATRDDDHILEMDDTAYPEKYQPLVRLLNRAISNEEIRDTMDAEDEILRDFENLERHIDRQDEIIEEQGKTIEEKGKALGEKDKALEEQGKALGEKDKALEELRRQLQQLHRN